MFSSYKWIAGSIAFVAMGVLADEFTLGDITGAIKTNISEGAAWRVDTPDSNLIGKQNINPNLCPDACLSFTGDREPNRRLVAAPGGFFASQKDDGDLNYHQGSVTSAVTKFGAEVTAGWGNFAMKVGGTAYYDPVNYIFREHHPDTTFQPSRTDRREDVERSAGLGLDLKDAFVSGKFNLLGQDFSAIVGYQHIRWGESNFVAINSLNEWNSPDERLLHQPGTQINEVFRPIPAITLNFPLPKSFALDLIYQLAWVPVKADPDGTFFGNIDIINNDNALLSLGQFHEDPNGKQRLPSPGNLISNTSLTIPAYEDGYAHPRDMGQFGAKLSYFAEDLNGGTEFGFYAMNYHSRLPYLSFYASDASCANKGVAGNFVSAFLVCNGFKSNPTGGQEPLPLDTARLFFDYPENIQLYGVSFNTNLGKWSLAGEVSYRPNLPVQIEASDLLFAAIQPGLPAQDLALSPAIVNGLGATLVNPNNQLSAGEVTSLTSLLAAVGPGILQGKTYTIPSGRSAAPDNISSYRHYTVQPNMLIRGYERVQTSQFDLTGIRALGSSDNPIGADQIIFLVEGGLTWYMDLPSKRLVQFEANNAHDTHYSPGADGSDGGNTETLNPTKQYGGFATPVSMGVRSFTRLEYDDVFWGLNFKPSLLLSYDVYGNVAYQQNNFQAGTKSYVLGTEIEAGNQWSGQIFYQGSTGGFSLNSARDRDEIAVAIAYQF